ncbi:MAG: hypothetical protein NVSMB42_05510 [Herpetosiphon sp.]
MNDEINRRAPMASAPLKYSDDGAVDWGSMWDTFCVLAQEGGPPHRSTLLQPGDDADPTSTAYQWVVAEIIRGIAAVSALPAEPASPGWIAVHCSSAAMAHWLATAIQEENVMARAEGTTLFVPAGQHYTLTGEIKNVVTAVAKTTHYWVDHLPPDVQRAMALEAQLKRIKTRVAGWFGRRPH